MSHTATPLTSTPRPSHQQASLVAEHRDNVIVTFRLNPDMVGACEDQARSQGIPFAEWLQQTANDALRAYLGI